MKLKTFAPPKYGEKNLFYATITQQNVEITIGDNVYDGAMEFRTAFFMHSLWTTFRTHIRTEHKEAHALDRNHSTEYVRARYIQWTIICRSAGVYGVYVRY